jgi:transcriptional regulator with XRE-family HTH domain
VVTFQEWLEERVQRAGGWRQAAAKSGISHSTLMKAAGRIGDGKVDLASLEAIAKWNNVPIGYVVSLYRGETDADRITEMELIRLKQEYPGLADALALAAELGEDDLKDVLEYIKFKASQRA